MSDSSHDSRTTTTPSVGAKWAILVGLPFLVLAAYFFLTPVALSQVKGGFFYCGSAASPNSEAANVCAAPEKIERNKALASLATGLAIPLAGLGLFGLTKGTQSARRDLEGDRRREDDPRERRGLRGGRDDFDDVDDLDDRDDLRRGGLDEPRERRRGRDDRAGRFEDDADGDLDVPRSRRRDDDWSGNGRA